MESSESTNITDTEATPNRGPRPRDQWNHKIEFLLSCIGFAVGLGNIWRFPYLCYSNGGGVFLIPYVFMLAFLGLPLFYLELALGQYASLGSISIWKLAPLCKGIGYAMNIVGAFVGIYYNVIISYTFFYFFASFTTELPWRHCGNPWNNNLTCVEPHSKSSVIDSNISSIISTSNMMTTVSTLSFSVPASNISSIINSTSNMMTTVSTPACNASQGETPATQYWNHYVLGRSPAGMAYMGPPRWRLTLCLLLSWIVVFLCIIKGIKSAGKVAYFTATFPYVVLIILFFRGVTLEGHTEGILYYITPRWAELWHVKVWKDAAIQILYSLGPGFGGLISMGSFNKFNNNCQRDAIIVTIVNCGTSVFAGFVIFSVLGYMSYETCTPIEDVAEEGPGLAFVAYPQALALMPGGPFWAIMFFFMLILLGINSQFVGIQCFVTAVSDDIKWLQLRKTRFTLAVCLLGFFLGIPCVTEGGIYLVQLMDKYATSFPLLIIVLFETTTISWMYGIKRVRRDIAVMVGFKPNYFWLSCWAVISPLIIAILLILASWEYRHPTYYFSRAQAPYIYPGWAESLGWCMSLASIIMIPLFAVLKFCKCVGSFQNFMIVLRGPMVIRHMMLQSLWIPTDGWGPALAENRAGPSSPQVEVSAQYHCSDNPDDTDNPVKLQINFANGASVIPDDSHI